ncbi:conserved Plasmodium protein, unknown function, partial [Plasmodium malariae]
MNGTCHDNLINNKLINNINSNFNDLIMNMNIDSNPIPNNANAGLLSSPKVRRKKKSVNSVGENIRGHISGIVRNNINNNNSGEAKKVRKSRISKKESTKSNTSKIFMNEQGKLIPLNNNVQSNLTVSGIYINAKDRFTSENNDCMLNLSTNINMNSVEYSSNNNINMTKENTAFNDKDITLSGMYSLNEENRYMYDGQHLENDHNKNRNKFNKSNFQKNEILNEKGSTNMLNIITCSENMERGEKDLNNRLNKNGKVKKYRRRKNNNLELTNQTKLSPSFCNNVDVDGSQRNVDLLNMEAANVNIEIDQMIMNKESTKFYEGRGEGHSYNNSMNMMLDNISSEGKINVNVKGEQINFNSMDDTYMGDHEDLSTKYLLNFLVEDYKKESNSDNNNVNNNNVKSFNDKSCNDDNNVVTNESRRKNARKEMIKKEKGARRNKGKIKTKEMQMTQMLQYYESKDATSINDLYNNEENNSYIKKNKNMKKLCFPQSNFTPNMKGSRSLIKSLSRNIRINTINTFRKKYKKFSFCLNRVFKKKNINDIIALNENINNNKDMLSLFKKKDIHNLRRKNLAFFMGKLQLQKIDMLIIKRIHICLDKIKSTLGFTCIINNVEKVVDILKNAFKDRLHLIWPLIEFSNNYRLDQYFHLLGKNRNNANSRFKNSRLFVHQNINSLIMYFNQRTLDDKLVEHLKNQMKPKKRRRKNKNKNKEPYLDEKSLDQFFKTMINIPLNNITTDSLLDLDTAETKANEFAFVSIRS